MQKKNNLLWQARKISYLVNISQLYEKKFSMREWSYNIETFKRGYEIIFSVKYLPEKKKITTSLVSR